MIKSGVAAVSVDTALTRNESKNRKQLRINYVRFFWCPERNYRYYILI